MKGPAARGLEEGTLKTVGKKKARTEAGQINQLTWKTRLGTSDWILKKNKKKRQQMKDGKKITNKASRRAWSGPSDEDPIKRDKNGRRPRGSH